VLVFGTGLETPAIGHEGQFHAPALPVGAEFFQGAAQEIVGQFGVEHTLEFGQGQGRGAGQEDGFQDALDLGEGGWWFPPPLPPSPNLPPLAGGGDGALPTC
jgi:hypothetical protein